MFTELYREEKREEGERGGQEEKRGESKGERQIQLVISSLSVLHRLEHTGDSQSCVEKRRWRKETEETWWRKRRVQREREQSSQ